MNMASQVMYSSVQLVQLDSNNQPKGIASGCLVRCKGKTILLTVEHVTGNHGNWAIQLDYDKARGVKCYQLGAMNFLKRLSGSAGTLETIDFSYAIVPEDLKVCRQSLTLSGETTATHEVPVFVGPFEVLPTSTELFAFAGSVMPTTYENVYDQDRPVLDCELAIYTGLTFLRTEGDFHVFKLPFSHSGHPNFKGCSGAPILNGKGHPVALVASGIDTTDEIFGVALNHFMPIIEMTI